MLINEKQKYVAFVMYSHIELLYFYVQCALRLQAGFFRFTKNGSQNELRWNPGREDRIVGDIRTRFGCQLSRETHMLRSWR